MASSSGVTAQSQVDKDTADITRTGVINGRVVTESGQPLENIAVFIRALNVSSQPTPTSTDSEGRFQVAGLEPTLYTVGASVPGYVPLPREADSRPSFYRIGDSVTLTFMKGSVITGAVTSASGEPLVMTGVRAILIREVDGQKSALVQNERMTDDRGVYRLYGLQPGTYLISTTGRPALNFYGNANENDVPTYAPSSTRDNAVEINVRSGEERSGIDIRYRIAEPGHLVSGTVDGPSAPTGNYSGARVNLTQISNGTRWGVLSASQAPGTRGFSLDGVADGEYELTAISALGPNELAISEPRRILVKGADVTRIELTTKLLGSISGHLALEKSTALECKDKRKPLLAETLVLIQNNSKEPARYDPRIIWYARQLTPDKSGDVLFSNLAAGQYRFDLQFSAKYWYLKAIAPPLSAGPADIAKSAPASRQNDAARNWITLKQGERLNGLTLTLAEGAGSLRGSIKPAEGERIPAQLDVYLIPAEKEYAEDVLRYFATAVNADGTFALGNLPPGRYWALSRVSAGNGTTWASKLRLPEESPARLKLRKEAEAAKTEIEFKPCQNVIDYQFPLKS
jgi:hypothetical protein